MKYSVVIIAYNEEENILNCIDSVLAARDGVQIILADGGSRDATIGKALLRNAGVVRSKLGRGPQCNAGALEADGEIILFLHSDTTLPESAFEVIDKHFSAAEVQIGTFRLEFDRQNLMLSLYSKLTSIDSVLTRFGDQCIVVRKDFLNRLNGFNDWPLFEDVDLLRRARRLTRIYSLPARVTTSSRRFIKEGFIRQQLLNGLRIFQFLSGVPPYKIAGKYNTKKNEVNSPGKGAS